MLVKRALILAALPILLLTGPASSLPSSPDRSVVLRQAAGEQEQEADDAGGIHGGTVERVHQGCTFPDGLEAPAGNWTHGDYVGAWSASGGTGNTTIPAHSQCGKPAHAGKHHAGAPGKSGNAPGKSGSAPGHSGTSVGASGQGPDTSVPPHG